MFEVHPGVKKVKSYSIASKKSRFIRNSSLHAIPSHLFLRFYLLFYPRSVRNINKKPSTRRNQWRAFISSHCKKEYVRTHISSEKHLLREWEMSKKGNDWDDYCNDDESREKAGKIRVSVHSTTHYCSTIRLEMKANKLSFSSPKKWGN